MNKILVLAIAAGAVGLVSADTLAWYHFDERAPGERAAAADVIANGVGENAPGKPIAIDSTGTLVTADDSPWMPTYGTSYSHRGVPLLVVDPVSGAVHANRSAMSFRTGGTDSALNGGAVMVEDDKSLNPASYTIEALVCTTGGAFNTISPIFGRIPKNASFMSEYWHVGMLKNGKLFLRCTKSSGNAQTGTDGSGSAKINDGKWHHIALVSDSENPGVRVYVDYAQDIVLKGNDAAYVGGPSYSDKSPLYVGGYPTSSVAGRKFNGLVDELRISDRALQPAEFLQFSSYPDGDVPLYLPLDGEVGLAADTTGDGLNAVHGKWRTVLVSGGDPTPPALVADVPTSRLYARFSDGEGVDNPTSVSLTTNALGVGSGMVAAHGSQSAFARSSFTLEMFLKTRRPMAEDIDGSTAENQAVFKLGGSPTVQVTLQSSNKGRPLFVYYNKVGGKGWSSAPFGGNDCLDDCRWHHLAVVYDRPASNACVYVDYVRMLTVSQVDFSLADEDLGIGCSNTGKENFFDGQVDAVRVTTRALSPMEFQSGHSVAESEPGILLHAKFDNEWSAHLPVPSFGPGVVVAARNEEGRVPEFSEDVVRPCVALDGQSAQEIVTNAASISVDGGIVGFPYLGNLSGSGYTVEYFVKVERPALNGNLFRLNDTPTSMTSGGIWSMYFDGTSFTTMCLRGYFYEKGKSSATEQGKDVDGFIFDDGRWHHVAVTVAQGPDGDSTEMNVYFDYRLMTSEPLVYKGVLKGSAQCASFGSHNGGVEGNMKFKLDELRISSGVLPVERFERGYRYPSGTILVVR